MGLEKDKQNDRGEESDIQESGDERDGNMKRNTSETSLYTTEDEDSDGQEHNNKIQLGPQCTLKEHIEKDKVCFSHNLFDYIYIYIDNYFVVICNSKSKLYLFAQIKCYCLNPFLSLF